MTTKRGIFGTLAFVVFGCMVLLKAIDNPRLRELRVPDALLLVAIGMFIGVGLAQLPRLGKTVTDEKKSPAPRVPT